MKKTIPALPVQDIKQSIEFYTTRFGFTLRHHEGGFAIVVRDDVELHLWQSGDETWKNKGATLAAIPICSGAESFLAGTTSCRIEVQGINELFEEYKKQGVLYASDTVIQEQPWGDREFPLWTYIETCLPFMK